MSNKLDKEFEIWKKENNYTDEDLDFMWDFCVAFKHPTISSLNKSGVGWRNLNKTVIMNELPSIYENTRNKEIYLDYEENKKK